MSPDNTIPATPPPALDKTAGTLRSTVHRPKLLCLVHRVPYPPNRGDRIRSYHILRHLSQWADLWLATLADEPVSERVEARLHSLCRDVAIEAVGRRARWARAAASFAVGRTATEGLFHSPSLKRTIREWAGSVPFDLVLTVCSSMSPYAQLSDLDGVPWIADLVDVDSEKWANYASSARLGTRQLYAAEAKRLRRLEQQLGRQARAVLFASQQEARLFNGFANSARVLGIPNGVDLTYFDPSRPSGVEPGDSNHLDTGGSVENKNVSCVFVGALDYRPNVDGVLWFARHVWPRVRARHPEARFAIVGRNPTLAVSRLDGNRGIAVVPDVPDVRPFLASAALVIAPLRMARGIQNKVLEALAMRKTVVASPQALEGLDLAPGVHLLQADGADDWVETLDRALNDASWRESLASAGRTFVEEKHCWDRCLVPLDDVIRRLIEHPPATTHQAS